MDVGDPPYTELQLHQLHHHGDDRSDCDIKANDDDDDYKERVVMMVIGD